MLPSRLTQALAAAAGILILPALLLDDPAYLLAGGAFLILILTAAASFMGNVRTILLSAVVQRSPGRETVRQGNSLDITTKLTCTVPHGIRVTGEEILPASGVMDGGKTEGEVSPEGELLLSYRVIPVLHGKLRIRGTRLRISDRFFRTSVDLTAERFSQPDVQVQPRPFFESGIVAHEFGGRETDRVSIYHGFGIRSHRVYVAGDDLKDVDWKMSAKHQKMFVKEYTSAEQFPPLLVLDLPPGGTPYDPEEIHWLAGRITGDMETSIGPMGSVSVVIISGINIINILLQERSLALAIAPVREKAHPVNRLHHAYRMKTRTGIRVFQMRAARLAGRTQDPDLKEYLHTISDITSRSLVRNEVPAFEAQAERLFRRGPFGSVRIYSLLEGDLSHIGILLSLARALKIKTRIISPTASDGRRRLGIIREFGEELLEVTQ